MKIEYRQEIAKKTIHKRPPLIYYFKPDRWKAWWLGKKTKWARKIIQENTTDIDIVAYAEQLMWRRKQCPCWDQGKANCCGCPSHEKIIQATEECKWKMWPPMMPARAWNIYKIKNNIVI